MREETACHQKENFYTSKRNFPSQHIQVAIAAVAELVAVAAELEQPAVARRALADRRTVVQRTVADSTERQNIVADTQRRRPRLDTDGTDDSTGNL